jgi:PHP family Zn ribbon phosphoesterase
MPKTDMLKPDYIKTIGWVLDEEDEFITVYNQEASSTVAGVICIPQAAILKIEEIEF